VKPHVTAFALVMVECIHITAIQTLENPSFVTDVYQVVGVSTYLKVKSTHMVDTALSEKLCKNQTLVFAEVKMTVN